MSAQSLEVITLDFPNPDFAATPAAADSFKRINASISFTYLTSFNLRTLSTNGVSSGNDVSGLLYVPDLITEACKNASAPYVPANVTREDNLPDVDYDLIGIAPWTSPTCVQEYFASAREAPIRGLLFFLPGDNTTMTPPEVDSNVWGLGDGGSWKRQNEYPVYAIPGQSARIMLDASTHYSGNMTQVPHGHQLIDSGFDPRDYVRLFVDIDTAGGGSNLPSLWVFLLVVLGILLAIIGATSLMMHWLQRRRRQTLRRRVANGEVDLEALGIKRLTVPQEILDGMPLYTYGSGTPVPPVAAKDVSAVNKLESASSSRPSSPLPSTRPAPAVRAHSFRPTPLQQPTCAICLDDFVPGSAETEGTIVRELPCHHIFHPECVDTFLRDSSSLCPMCKKSALPKGYCPRVVTNAMVRRERVMRRVRERVTDAPEPEVEVGSTEGDDSVPPMTSIGSRLRTRTFSGLSQLRAGRRISSAPTPSSQAMTEMTPSSPAPVLVRSNSATSPNEPAVQRVQPPSTPGRREWARQRAIAMLGRRAPSDPDEEEERTTPGWRKALGTVFPGLSR